MAEEGQGIGPRQAIKLVISDAWNRAAAGGIFQNARKEARAQDDFRRAAVQQLLQKFPVARLDAIAQVGLDLVIALLGLVPAVISSQDALKTVEHEQKRPAFELR